MMLHNFCIVDKLSSQFAPDIIFGILSQPELLKDILELNLVTYNDMDRPGFCFKKVLRFPLPL